MQFRTIHCATPCTAAANVLIIKIIYSYYIFFKYIFVILQIKMEPKEPIKLNLKILSKKIQLKTEPSSRPPLKLTLPKPAMYPYTTPLRENKLKKEEEQPLQIGGENKSWFITMEHPSHIKTNSEHTGLKVKLTKQGDLPYVAVPSNPTMPHSFHNTFL